MRASMRLGIAVIAVFDGRAVETCHSISPQASGHNSTQATYRKVGHQCTLHVLPYVPLSNGRAIGPSL
jgi:hypothetical protein